jgi:DNA-directed RNA polymerase subunit RPC12/RpoP
MIDELDTRFTDEIVCPYCRYVFRESYEYIGDDIVDCPNCEHRFVLESEEYVVYTTSKVDWLKQWRIYNREQIYRSEWQRYHNLMRD